MLILFTAQIKYLALSFALFMDLPNANLSEILAILSPGDDEAPEKDDIIAKEGNDPPHKKNKKHRKHKSKKKKKKRKGEKESSSESGAESDVEPTLPQKPLRNTRARSVI